MFRHSLFETLASEPADITGSVWDFCNIFLILVSNARWLSTGVLGDLLFNGEEVCP